MIASQRTAKTGLGSAQQALRDAYKARAAAMGGSAQDYLNANNALRAAKNNFRTAQSAYDDAVRQYGTAKTMIGLRNQVPNILRGGALTFGGYQMGKGLGLWGDEE